MQTSEKRPNHPFIAREAHYRRVDDLLEGNNRYLERARTAEARVKELESYLEGLRGNIAQHALASAQMFAQVAALHDEMEDRDDSILALQLKLEEAEASLSFSRAREARPSFLDRLLGRG